MKEKIFGIGLSRTGTTSFHELLIALGYNSGHFSQNLLDNSDFDIMTYFDAMTDTPIPMLYQMLDKKYPNSKFVLTTREKSEWLKSMKWMFNHGKVIWNWPKSTQAYHRKFYKTIKYNKRILSKHYDVYHNEVREYFKDRPQDLLVIDMAMNDREKVITICNFLNLSKKDIEFPKSNKRKNASLLTRIKYRVNRIFDPH